MCDFIIHFDPNADPAKAERLLRDRPGMSDAALHRFRFPWGYAVIQEPRGRGYAPYLQDGELFACVARPRFMGITHEDRGDDGFNRIFAERWYAGDRKALFDALTGMYALVHCHAGGADILTDQMGFQPVYQSTAKRQDGVVIGTDVEAVANMVDGATDFDLTSLGELIVYNYVTFPHTSRQGVRELDPACLNCLDSHGAIIGADCFWTPDEPAAWPSRDEIVDQIESALRNAAEDITRGAESVGVTLSGGMDSRVILAAVPRERNVSAVTYVTRINREVETARQVAEAWGVEQVLAWREPEYFTDLLLERGPGLLGIERRGAAHGFCVKDNGLDQQFDLILGGQLSDTFLKDHFMPKHEKEKYRTRYLPERSKLFVKHLLGMSKAQQAATSPLSTIGRHLLEKHLQPGIRDEVQARRSQRLKQIERTRPHSAEEWARFWPTSRQDDTAHIGGNMKLFAFDSLFMHRQVVDVACRIHPRWRYAGRAAHEAFRRVYGALGRIQNANTLLPADASERELQRHRKGRTSDRTNVDASSDAPWNNVQGSWVDLELLQRHSPSWQARRESLYASPACQVLDQVVNGSASEMIRTYRAELTPGLNVMILQLARVMDSLLDEQKEAQQEPGLYVQL